MSRQQNQRCLYVVLGAMLLIHGCGYPKVSPLTYQYAKALVSITNRQATEKLQDVRSRVGESLEQNEITEQESEWLLDIIDDADSGDWKTAASKSRAIMEAQTSRID